MQQYLHTAKRDLATTCFALSMVAWGASLLCFLFGAWELYSTQTISNLIQGWQQVFAQIQNAILAFGISIAAMLAGGLLLVLGLLIYNF